MGAPRETAWQSSRSWPPPGLISTSYYFAPGRSGTASSVNDGSLITVAPREPVGFDPYTVDYTTTSGRRSRWSAVNFPHDYPDRRNEDAKALTYTGVPLAEARDLIGHSIAHIWLATAAPDLDVFAYVEEVTADGTSRYVTEGTLRASHRKLSDAPFKTLGLPWHSHFASDLMPVPPMQPIELTFALLPTCYRFAAGSRVRITVAFADADNFETPILAPTPTVHMLRDAPHGSYLELPFMPPAEAR